MGRVGWGLGLGVLVAAAGGRQCRTDRRMVVEPRTGGAGRLNLLSRLGMAGHVAAHAV